MPAYKISHEYVHIAYPVVPFPVRGSLQALISNTDSGNSTAINKIISFFIFLKFKALQSYGELTGKRENTVFQKR